MKPLCMAAGVLGAVIGSPGTAGASAFTLHYCASRLAGGEFAYNLTLTLDNHDGSWTPGSGIGWVVFGDSPVQGQSPLNDFVGDTAFLPVGPWIGFDLSDGAHNGPTFIPVVLDNPPYDAVLWIPAAVGDRLTWRGTASQSLAAGQLLWSALSSRGGPHVSFEVGVLDCGPICGTADFNGDGDVGTDQDIEAFFACLAGNCCSTCGTADFNGDSDVGTDQDIEAFFRVLAGGVC